MPRIPICKTATKKTFSKMDTPVWANDTTVNVTERCCARRIARWSPRTDPSRRLAHVIRSIGAYSFVPKIATGGPGDQDRHQQGAPDQIGPDRRAEHRGLIL